MAVLYTGSDMPFSTVEDEGTKPKSTREEKTGRSERTTEAWHCWTRVGGKPVFDLVTQKAKLAVNSWQGD